MERKLSTILSADVQGYSRLMGQQGWCLLHRLLGKQGGAMKSFNWQDLLRGHSLFSSLTAVEITQLLKDEASQEKVYHQGSVILSEGEFGDSLFLIGSGSVQVTLQGTAGQHLPLAILKAAEFFGEIAVLERRPRSATVTARENCMLLEVKGEEFRNLLEAHPEIRSKVRAKMGERLGPSSQQ